MFFKTLILVYILKNIRGKSDYIKILISIIWYLNLE